MAEQLEAGHAYPFVIAAPDERCGRRIALVHHVGTLDVRLGEFRPASHAMIVVPIRPILAIWFPHKAHATEEGQGLQLLQPPVFGHARFLQATQLRGRRGAALPAPIAPASTSAPPPEASPAPSPVRRAGRRRPRRRPCPAVRAAPPASRPRPRCGARAAAPAAR